MTSKDELRELKEKLAAIEHERWADWQSWVHSKCKEFEDEGGEYVGFPDELYKRWERQIATPYEQLSDQEKASDMEQVDRYWPLILNLLEGEKQKLEEQYIDKDPEVRAAIYAVESIIKSTVPRDGKWREASFSIMMKPPKHIEVATLNKEPNKGEDVDG